MSENKKFKIAILFIQVSKVFMPIRKICNPEMSSGEHAEICSKLIDIVPAGWYTMGVVKKGPTNVQHH